MTRIAYKGGVYGVIELSRLTGASTTSIRRWLREGNLSEEWIDDFVHWKRLHAVRRHLGLSIVTVQMRIVRGWDVDLAFTTPLGKPFQRNRPPVPGEIKARWFTGQWWTRLGRSERKAVSHG